LIPRGQHTDSHCLLDVPDDATAVRIDVARNHSNDRTLWPSADDFATWALEQSAGEGWSFLGDSTTHGGVVLEEDGTESESSWDETPLRTYRIEIGDGRIYYVGNDAHLASFLQKWKDEQGITPAAVTRLRGRKVRVRLVAHHGPVDTHVAVKFL
jgi:hypothetical protein